MPNQITRDIYVTKDVLKNPIHYVRGTDLIPIVMRFCDFTIPSGATARIFVGKPDGNAVYTSATIEGNTVTIDVTEQMFVTLGLALMQVSIMDGGEELVTFAQPVMVEPNLKAGDFPESSTDIAFLDDAIEQANEAVETATTAAKQAATAVQNANTAISKANSAIADVNEAVASMNANFANLAQVTTINALQTTAKTVVGAINELNSKTPTVRENTSYNGESVCHGMRMDIGNLVIAVGIYEIVSQISAFSLNYQISAPKYGQFYLKDSTGEYNFQVNNLGVFQNAQTLQPGTYVAYAVYIKS